MPEMTAEQHEAFLEHIGIIRKSGRYPWGSGGDPYQRSKNFQAYLGELQSKGLTEPQIAKYIQDQARQYDPHAHFTTDDLRANISISTDEIRAQNIGRAVQLRNAVGREMGASAIAKQMGVTESTVRGWLKASEERKESALAATANKLREEVAAKPFLDVGKGQHLHLGVTETKMRTAIARLRDEGYEVHPIKIPQLGIGVGGNQTKARVLCKPGTTFKEARDAVLNRGELRTIAAQSDDGGLTFRTPKALPVSVNSKRIEVRHKEDGGAAMDGVIELRRGVDDLSLGANRYGQVRISVDGTHYLKGMAMYADDLPAGVDIRFNSNKPREVGKLGAMKTLELRDGKIDPDSPFGSTVTPLTYKDKNGREKTSALNAVGSRDSLNVEGRWDGWSRSLSSQMLSKQPITLASEQLGKARSSQEKSLKEIMALTNPVVKRQLLDDYAESADAAAVHLKAAALKDQSTHVLLPMNSMRPNEIYAPNFDNGTKVVLVRHPHGGPFEIPELTVNNRNQTARRILGANTRDAVGIHHSVAEQLSGADFDGDTVLVIPNNSGRVKTRPPLADLKGFDPKVQYKIDDDDTTTPRMKNTQTEMGKISNLITDMSIKGANDEEMARAIKHSMVVIDAEKHGLNYKQSAIDNRITELKKTYQGSARSGAGTIISKAKARPNIPEVRLARKNEGGPVNPKTGELNYVPTGRVHYKTGKPLNAKGSKMQFVKDARELTSNPKSPHPMEEVYAQHANSMKALANFARKESLSLEMPKVTPAAKAFYADQIASLNQKLQIAQRNAPLERRAQALGNAWAKARIDARPDADDDDVKKIRYDSLAEARALTGAAKERVHISEPEWRAIQAGAVAHTKLAEIFRHADMERVKELATPRRTTYLTPGQMARARALQASGKPLSQIAEQLGIPRTTLADNLDKG